MAYDYIVKVGADVDDISSGIVSAIRKADGSKIRIKCEDKDIKRVLAQLSKIDAQTADKITLDIDGDSVTKTLTQIRNDALRKIDDIKKELESIDVGSLNSDLEKQRGKLQSKKNELNQKNINTLKNLINTHKLDPNSDSYVADKQKLADYVETYKAAGGEISEISDKVKNAIQDMTGNVKTLGIHSQLEREVALLETTIVDLGNQIQRYHDLKQELSEYQPFLSGSGNGSGTGSGLGISEADLKSLTALLESMEKSLSSVASAFGKLDDESNLSDLITSMNGINESLETMKKLFADVGDGQEFSPLFKIIKDITSAIDTLNETILNGVSVKSKTEGKITEGETQTTNSKNTKKGKDTKKSKYGIADYKDLKSTFSGMKLGDAIFNDVTLDSSGNVVIHFIEQVGDVSEVTTVKVNDLNDALNRINKTTGVFDNKGLDTKYSTKSSKKSNSKKPKTTKSKTDRDIENAINRTKSAMNEINAKGIGDGFEAAFNNAIQEIEKLNESLKSGGINLEEYKVKVKDIKDALSGSLTDKVTKDIDRLNNALKNGFKSDKGVEKFKNALTDVIADYNKLIDLNAQGIVDQKNFESVSAYFETFKSDLNKELKFETTGKPQEFINQLNEAKVQLVAVQNVLDKVRNKEPITAGDIEIIKQYISQVRELKSSTDKIANSSKVSSMLGEIADVLNDNTAMSKELRQEFEQLQAEMKAFDGVIPEEEFKQFGYRLEGLKTQLKESGQTGLSFFDGVMKKARTMSQNFIAMYFSLYDVIRYIRTGLTYITELDTAFTEMRKVSNESTESLREFQRASFDIAGAVGTTAKQIQNSTADWMRLGESLEEASKSAEVSNILLNVSEFESIDDATESLVSMSAAYDELSKMDIIDKLNNIGNNYSISTDGLATALQRSASALRTAGNDMDEAVALVTAGNAVVQNPDSVGAGLRTIALRITGTESARAELEELGEDVDDFMVQTTAKSQQTIKDFTKVASNNFEGFDILDENGNFKSTYEILLGISKIYKEIQETDKEFGSNMANGLLEALAGKNRANIAASILESPELLESVYESSQDSAGSAEQELSKYLDSIEGKIQQFTNEVQEFWYNLISSDTIKGIIDIGTAVVDILGDITGALGEVGTLAVAIGGGLGIKAAITGDLQKYIAGLQQVSTVMDKMKGTSAIVDGTTNLLTQNSVAALTSAISGLSQEQALLVLSTKNLSQAQTEQVLSAAGLLAAEQQLTAAQISERLAKEMNSKADAEALLLKAGIITQKELEENATVKVTAAKLNEAIANGTLSASDGGVIAGALGITGVNAGATISFKALTASIWANVEAIGAWLISNPVGWCILAVGGILAVKTAIDSANKKYTELIEKSEQAADSIKTISDDFKQTEKTVSEISDRFAELAQGVDLVNGKNFSLSDGEYKEFLDLSNQLADLFPTLSRRYDENGNAIVQLSGDADTMVGSLESLLEVQRQLANQRIVDELPDLFAGVAAKSDVYTQEIESAQKKQEALNSEYEVFLKSQPSFDDNNILTLHGSNIDEYTTLVRKYSDIFKDLDLNYDFAGYEETFDEQLRKNITTGYKIKFSDFADMDQSQIEKIKQDISAAMAGVSETYNTEIEGLNDVVLTKANENKANWNSVLSSISSWLATDSSYKVLSDDLQSMISSMMSSMDFSQIIQPGWEWEDFEKYLTDSILNPIKNASNKDELSEAWSELLQINVSKISVDEATSVIDENIAVLSKALGKSEDELKIQFGFTAYDDVDALKKDIKDALPEISDEYLGALTLSDLKIASNVSDKVVEQLESNVAESQQRILERQMDIYKYLGSNAVANTQDVLNNLKIDTNISAYEEAHAEKFNKFPWFSDANFMGEVDSYIGKVNELQIALGKLNDGSFTDSDFQALVKTFPDLANETDNLDGAIVNLIGSMNTDAISLFEKQFGTIDSSKDVENLEEFMHTVLDLGSTVGNTEFSIEFFTEEANSIEQLNAAMQESVSATGLSAESISNLKNRYSEFIDEGYDINKLFEETYNGIHLNKDALNELEEAYAKRRTKEIQNDIDELTNEYDRLTQEISLCTDAQRLQELYSERDIVISKINDLGTLASQYEGLTSAYKKWQDAQSNGEEGDLYDGVREGKENAQQLYKDGLIGTNEFRTYVDLLSNEDLSGADPIAIQAEWQKLNKTIEGTSYSAIDFLDEGSDGVLNFLHAVQDLNPEWAKLNADGSWTGNFGYGNDEEIAKALGIDIEYLQSILRKLSDYGFDINLDSVHSSLADLQDEAQEANDVINSIFDDDFTFNFKTTNLENLTDVQLPKAKEYLDRFRDEDNNIDFTIEGAKEAQTILITLLRQKQELTKPEIMAIDTSSLSSADDDIANALSLLQEFTELSNTLEIQKELGVDTSATEEKLKNVSAELTKIEEDTWAKINIDDEAFNSQLKTLSETDLTLNNAHLSAEAIAAIQTSIQSIDAGSITLTDNSDSVMANLTAVDDFEVEDKNFKVKLTNNPLNELRNINTYKIDDKSYTITKTIKTTYDYNNDGQSSNGTANSLGFGLVQGTAFAKGNWGTNKSGVALGGEVGQELVVRDGRFFTIGDNGAEFFQYKKDDIIFNAGQTAQIFKYGKIKNGKKRGEVFAQGNAFVEGTAFSDFSGTIHGNGSVKTSSTGSGKSGNSKGNSSSGDAADEFKEVLDWIERKIKDIERDIDNLDQTASATYKSWSDRNSALTAEMAKVTEEIDIQQQAYERYMQEANSVGLDETYAELVREGTIDIETITDEELHQQIQDYQNWYDKATDCQDAVQDLQDNLAELTKTKFDNVISQFEDLLSVIEHTIDMLDGVANQIETEGYIVSAKVYEALKDSQEQQRDTKINERNALQQELEEALSTPIDEGGIAYGSSDYYEMLGEIQACDKEIQDLNTDIAETNKLIRETPWNIFDKMQEMIGEVNDEADFYLGLMSDEDMFNQDDASITEAGQAIFGLHAVKYNTLMSQANDYLTEIAKLDEEIAKDPFNQDLLDQRQEWVDSYRDVVNGAEDEKQAMLDLAKEGYDTFLSVMDKAIDKRKEMLNTTKDLYDYEKNVADQVEEIANLEKQLQAYSGDTSEAAKATVQQIKVSLEDAKENLEETEYDRYISDQEKMLDTMRDQTEEWIDERLKNPELLLQGIIDSTNANATTIKTTLENEATKIGTTLSGAMSGIWSPTEGEFGKVVTSYGENFGTTSTTTNSELGKIREYIEKMSKDADKKADDKIDNPTGEDGGSKGKAPMPPVETPKETPKDEAPKTETPKQDTNKNITVGSKINAGNARIYANSQGTGGGTQYFSSDPVYTVIGEENGYVRVRWHKLSSGSTGWFKKSDVKAYSTGGLIDYDGLAAVHGGTKPELVLNSKDTENFIALKDVLRKVDSENLLLGQEAIASLRDTMDILRPLVDSSAMQLPQMSARAMTQNVSIDIGDIQMYGVNDPETFAAQLKHNLLKNDSIKKIIQADTLGIMTGRNTLNKFKY